MTAPNDVHRPSHHTRLWRLAGHVVFWPGLLWSLHTLTPAFHRGGLEGAVEWLAAFALPALVWLFLRFLSVFACPDDSCRVDDDSRHRPGGA